MSWDEADPDQSQTEDDEQSSPPDAPEPESTGSPEQESSPASPRFYTKGKKEKGGKSVVKGCLVALIALVGVAFLLMVSVTLVLFASLMGGMAGMGGAGAKVQMVDGITLTQRTIQGQEGEKKIAVLPVHGMLVRDEYADPVRLLNAMLTMAENDEAMAAIILEVNSGGGSVHASDLLYQAVNEFKERTQMPVVVLMGGIAASGGYYVSCAGDRLVAQRTTMTGSIGVLLPLYDVTGLMKKVGVEDRSVASGPRKTMLSPTRERTPEEMARLEALVDSMHELFVEVVAEGRENLSAEEVAPLANGDIYTASEARDNGLVDKVGYLDTAVNEAVALAQLGKGARPHVVRYGRYMTFFEMLLARVESPGVHVELSDQMAVRLQNKPLYLWSPGTTRNTLTSQ